MKRLLRWIAWCAVLPACSSSETAIQLALQYDPSWGLDSVDVTMESREHAAPIATQVRLLVPDEWAGQAHHVDVWGLLKGQRFAHGQTDVDPIARGQVQAVVALAPMPTSVTVCGDGGCPVGCPAACTGAPPLPLCISTTVLRTFGGPGTCANSACSFPATDTICPNGCANGACVPACVAGDWVTDLIDSNETAGPGYGSLMVIDGAGDLQVLYPNAQIEYAHRSAGGPWATMSIGDNGAPESLALDPAGALHATCRGIGGLHHAYRPSTGAWTFSSIDPAGGTDSALVIDRAGAMHVTYFVGGNVLTYANFPPGGTVWSHSMITPIEAARGQSSSIAVDASGTLHVAYYDGMAPKYVSLAPGGGAWSVPLPLEPISAPTNFFARPQVAVDGLGGLHVAYYDGANADLKIVERPAGGPWMTPQPVDSEGSVGTSASLVIDRSGGLHIVYDDASHGQVRYAHRPAGGSWIIGTLPTGTDGASQPALAIDPLTGDLHVSYQAKTPPGLKHAYLPGCP